MSRSSIALAASSAAAALILSSAAIADTADSMAASADASAASNTSTPAQLQEIQVTAERLNQARSTIETQTGASTYTIDSEAINALPGGENVQLNQVLLQAPDVVQDSFGQIHVRADHNDLQYRLNGDHPARGHQRLQPDVEPLADLLAEIDHRRAAGGVRSAHRRHHRSHHQQRPAAAGRLGVGVRRQPLRPSSRRPSTAAATASSATTSPAITSRTISASSRPMPAPTRCTITRRRSTPSAISRTSSIPTTACR